MAVNPSGEMQYWDNGFPFGGVLLGSNDAGEMQFWDNGFPIVYQIPVSAAIPPIPNRLFRRPTQQAVNRASTY